MTNTADRDAAPAAAEGADALVAMRIKLPDVLARASVNGAEEYVKTAMQGMWPTERERWGHTLQCLEATIALAREALLARPASAAAYREGDDDALTDWEHWYGGDYVRRGGWSRPVLSRESFLAGAKWTARRVDAAAREAARGEGDTP